MRRGQRAWEGRESSVASGGSLTVWNPMRALTALASVDGQASSVVGRQRRRGGVRAVIEGTIVPGR